MKIRFAAIAAIAIAALSGCTTTEEAQQVIQSRWIGQPTDLFFTQYGPPLSSYQLGNGSVIHTWRGGDTTRYIAPTYSSPTPAKATTTTVREEVAPGRVVTRTTTVGAYPPAQPQMISPPQYQELYCELQITETPDRRIASIRASRDTDGEGLSLSRCAEVLNAHPKK